LALRLQAEVCWICPATEIVLSNEDPSDPLVAMFLTSMTL
jgi:hypothetical protein